MTELDAGIVEAHEAMDDPARDSSALRVANNRMAEAYTILFTRTFTGEGQQPERGATRPGEQVAPRATPFTGDGHRLDA